MSRLRGRDIVDKSGRCGWKVDKRWSDSVIPADVFPEIESRFLSAREEIYDEYLAANANAPLSRLLVFRDRVVVSLPNSIPNGEESALTIGRRFPPRRNQFRRAKRLFSVNRHRIANTSFPLLSFSSALLGESTLFDKTRQISLVLWICSFRYFQMSSNDISGSYKVERLFK